jgi:hypothetical protein
MRRAVLRLGRSVGEERIEIGTLDDFGGAPEGSVDVTVMT